MRSHLVLRASRLLLLATALATGCTVGTQETGSSDTSQCRIDTDVLCPGNFVGYSCQGKSKPWPTCSEGTLQFDGEIGYCCGVAPGN